MMKTAFSYPSSQRAGQRGQNYGLGINLLFFLTEISFFVVCVCARACLCVCVPMCVFVMWTCVGTGGGSRKVLGHLDLELQVTGYYGAPGTGSRNWNVVGRLHELLSHWIYPHYFFFELDPCFVDRYCDKIAVKLSSSSMSLLNTLLNPTFAPPLTFAQPLTFVPPMTFGRSSPLFFLLRVFLFLSPVYFTLYPFFTAQRNLLVFSTNPLAPWPLMIPAPVKKQELWGMYLQALPKLSRLKHTFSLWQGKPTWIWN